ncbi:MAG: HepT-like ribonuclease domain-containing protein [Egibacteraceae bacterium]
MVDAGRLRAILERVDRDLRRLRDLSATPAEVLIDEQDLLDAVKYRFVTAIEGLIDAEVAATAADIARFRNLLVHGYAEVDDERVVTILITKLDDLDRLRAALAATGSA